MDWRKIGTWNIRFFELTILLLLSFQANADPYLGISWVQISQDIGIQGDNDSPLDDTGCNYSSCGRHGDGSMEQSMKGSEVYIGNRVGKIAYEAGLSDLGTWSLTESVNTGSVIHTVRSNITMYAFHASVLRYAGPCYLRLGINLNNVTARSVHYTKTEEGRISEPYKITGTKFGQVYGLGCDYQGNGYSLRAEVKRFTDIGVIDITGTTEVRSVGVSVSIPWR